MFQRTDSLQRTMRPQPAVSRSNLARRAFRFCFRDCLCRPKTHWARHTLFDFDIAAEVDAFTCGVRRAFEWVGGFRRDGRSPCDGASKEATCANRVKRREQQLEPRAQETLLVDIALRCESHSVAATCHQRGVS